MKIKTYLLFMLILLCTSVSFAQTQKDQHIFKAMQDELERSMKLKLNDAESPFIISYYYVIAHQFTFTATLGVLANADETPKKTWGGLNVLVGNYDRTNETDFNGNVQLFEMPMQDDYDLIRQKYWQYTDGAYKKAVMQKGAKEMQKKRQDKKDFVLKDLIPVNPITGIVQPDTSYTFDKAEWIQKIKELSLIFKDYPQLFGSNVTISGQIFEVYIKTSEGVTMKRPLSSITLSASVNGIAKDGTNLQEHYSTTVQKTQDLPEIAQVKKQLIQLSNDLMVYKDAEIFDKQYIGPVLFEGGGAHYFFNRTRNALIACRMNGKMDTRMEIPLEERFGKKITDLRLSVKNYTNLKEYKGKALTGAYEIDAEGVIPAKELVLVEHGFLRNQLNNRIPARNFDKTTGSSRILIHEGSFGGLYIKHNVLPGVLHFSAEKGKSAEHLKKELLRTAKNEGLEYAYIIRKAEGNTRVYKVNVKDGKEVLQRNATISSGFEIGAFRILDFSNKEIISNAFLGEHYSVIFPSALLVEQFTLTPAEERNGTKPELRYPFEK